MALKRSIEKGSDTVAHVAQQRITAIWQQLRDLGLGEIRAHGQSVQFHKYIKYHVASLKPSCLDWLRKHRVTVSHFGPRARVDHSAFLGGRCPPDTDVEPVHPVVDPDMSSVPAQAAEQNPAGKNKRRKGVLQWRDVVRIDLGSPLLLSNKQLLQHLCNRPEWGAVKVSCRTLWQNKERILTEIRCVESETCPCRWRTHYMLAKTLYTPGTLVIQCSGEHAKHGDDPSASGKVFNQEQQDLAATFFAAAGRTAKNFRVALLAGGCSEASLPTNTQLSNWLKNARRKNKGALEKDQHIVAAVGLEVAALPRALPKQIDALFLLADPVITDAEVCVLFACPGMLNTFNRFAGDASHCTCCRHQNESPRSWDGRRYRELACQRSHPANSLDSCWERLSDARPCLDISRHADFASHLSQRPNRIMFVFSRVFVTSGVNGARTARL